jgi:hypothetical protein
MEHPATKHGYITTASGRRVYSLSSIDVHKPDIAHSLAMQCRYLGHVSEFYSVAEHSVLVSALADEAGETVELQQLALLHDAHESYCGDFPSPYKLDLPEHAEWEDRIERRVRESLGVAGTDYDWTRVKLYDTQALHLEASVLLPESVEWVDRDLVASLPRSCHVWCHHWRTAKSIFIRRAAQLGLTGYGS